MSATYLDSLPLRLKLDLQYLTRNLIVVGLVHTLKAEVIQFLATLGQFPQEFIDSALFC
jgi:hypothetical protein